MSKPSLILGIETSCDETAVAIYHNERGIIAHQIHSQIEMHAGFGGVVPELASRDHVRKLPGLVTAALEEAGCVSGGITAVAYTMGPGLIGALMVGAAFGRSLAYAWGVPAMAVHHMEAHLMAALLEDDSPDYPFLALLVSGGHTMLVHVSAFGQYALLGESLDDAVGEAFDKTAKLLGLPYPGGPVLAELARSGNDQAYRFSRPMLNRPGLDFSFSGLKTDARRVIDSTVLTEQTKSDIAASFELAVVDTLYQKTKRALAQTGLRDVVVVGGVSANLRLRDMFKSAFSEQGVNVYYPRHAYCTDNGAMVAFAGYHRFKCSDFSPLSIQVKPRCPL